MDVLWFPLPIHQSWREHTSPRSVLDLRDWRSVQRSLSVPGAFHYLCTLDYLLHSHHLQQLKRIFSSQASACLMNLSEGLWKVAEWSSAVGFLKLKCYLNSPLWNWILASLCKPFETDLPRASGLLSDGICSRKSQNSVWFQLLHL